MNNGTQLDAWIFLAYCLVPIIVFGALRTGQLSIEIVQDLPDTGNPAYPGCALILMLLFAFVLIVIFGDSNVGF